MNKITKDACRAFAMRKNFKRDNTQVEVIGTVTRMFLHDNLIAEYDAENGVLFIQDCGWTTRTTKERLNGVLDYMHTGARIYQKNGAWFLSVMVDDIPWTGRAAFTESDYGLTKLAGHSKAA